MSNFTSSIISTANIGEWDYYIFSDNVGIWRSLNGLAAWFNESGQLLQAAALLGSLVLLAAFLYGAAVKDSKASPGMLGAWFFFMSMLGLTGQANVYNIYTNQVVVVQNVPALALVPASIFSKAGFKVFTSMDTAFQGVNGSYMSVSQFGFIGPLELLLSLRSPKMAAGSPALTQTLTQVVHDCALDPNATGATPPMSKDLDMLNWLTLYGRSSGLTRVYTESDPTGNGTTIACKNGPGDPQVNIEGALYSGALDYVNRKYEIMASGSSEMLKFVNAETTRRNPQDSKGLWGTAGLQGSYDMLIGSAIGMTQNAVQFTKNALVASTITYTMDCLSQSAAITTPENCATGALALGDSMEKWKTEAAMSGSGFLKTMFTSMGVLQALFFALFPIIAIYALIVPMKTAKVFGGYIFFGMWCQSWLLVVAPIQSFIQTSIVDDMTKMIGSAGGMTLANSMSVYQLLSTKLAIAGDIMASSQMLSLALLSGSMVALSSLAGRWSGERHMDTSKVQLDAAKGAPLVEMKGMNSVGSMADSNGQMSSLNTKFGAGSYSLQSSYIQNSSKGHSNDSSWSHDKSRAKESAFQEQLMSKFGMSKDQAASVTQTMTAADSLNASVGTGVAKALGVAGGGLLSKLKGAPLNAQETAKLDSAVASSQEKAITQLAAKDAGFIDKLRGKAGADAQADAVGTVVDVAGGILASAMVAGEVMTGVGTMAAPATAAGMAAATQVAKQSLMSRIKSGAKDVAVATAANAAANVAVPKGPGGVEAFAKAIAGDTKALFQASVSDQMDSKNTSSSKKSLSKDHSFSASDVDKLGESWRASTTQSSTRSDSSGQTHTASVSLDKEQIMRAGLTGVGGISGSELQRRAAANTAMLQSTGSPAKVAAAWADVNMATMGRTAQDFGGGAQGQALSNYERNVLFEHFLTGQVNGSMMNSASGAMLGGTPASGPRPHEASVPSSVPSGGLGANVGKSKDFRGASDRLMARADGISAGEFNKHPSAQTALDGFAGGEMARLHEKRENEMLAIEGIGAASVVANATAGGMEMFRTAQANMPQPSSGGNAPGGDKPAKPAKPAEPAPTQREPVNRRTRMGRR